jgi:L-threonylcarbamoyladenylate synthase
MPLERIPLHELLSAGAGELRSRVAGRIRAGAVFVHPTETIYGIGGIVEPAVEGRICIAKGRPRENPMIVTAGRRETLERLAVDFPPAAERLARRFWPGSLTLVLPVRNAAQGLAVRVSGHPFARFVEKAVGRPIYSTSANPSGEAYVNDPERIARIFDRTADFMVDAGTLPESKPSTVVRIDENGVWTMVREGTLSRELIASVVGEAAGGAGMIPG